MNIGDFLWFYVTTPIKGVVGVGVVKDKYIDNTTLTWDEEWVKKKVIWPLRFRIQLLKVLPRSRWQPEHINIEDFRLFWQKGFHLLPNIRAVELFKRAKTVFTITEEQELFTGATIAPLPATVQEQKPLYLPESDIPAQPYTHVNLQETVAEIGKLQFYHTELEYPVDLPGGNRNLDVVWKREIDGAPTFAFEVELSGMIERAVDRLQFAFRRWNTRPRMIIPQKFVAKTYNAISISDREFAQKIKIYEPEQVFDLLKKKRELKQTEQILDLY